MAIVLTVVLLFSFSTCATMEWMMSAQWKTTSTYQRSTITMKQNRNRDTYTVLLVVLLTATKNDVFENKLMKIYSSLATHFFASHLLARSCFSM